MPLLGKFIEVVIGGLSSTCLAFQLTTSKKNILFIHLRAGVRRRERILSRLPAERRAQHKLDPMILRSMTGTETKS